MFGSYGRFGRGVKTCHHRYSTPPTFQPVASRYTDYTSQPTLLVLQLFKLIFVKTPVMKYIFRLSNKSANYPVKNSYYRSDFNN